MAEHTPGPWTWDLSYHAVRGESRLLAVPYRPAYDQSDEDHANMQLAATAPELLAERE